jgi:hypothetical protein
MDKDKFSLQPERKFKKDLLIGATYTSTTQPLLTATFTVGSGFVAGPATTAPFLNGLKLALWTGQTKSFLALKYFVTPPWCVQIVWYAKTPVLVRNKSAGAPLLN